MSKVSSTHRVKTLLKIALFSKQSTYSIFTKIQDGSRNFFQGIRSRVRSAEKVQNLLEITQSLTVSKVFDIFVFLPKFKMAAQSQKSKNF